MAKIEVRIAKTQEPLLIIFLNVYFNYFISDQIIITFVKPDAVTHRDRMCLIAALSGHPDGRSRFLKNAFASSGHSSSCNVIRKSISSSVWKNHFLYRQKMVLISSDRSTGNGKLCPSRLFVSV